MRLHIKDQFIEVEVVDEEPVAPTPVEAPATDVSPETPVEPAPETPVS